MHCSCVVTQAKPPLNNLAKPSCLAPDILTSRLKRGLSQSFSLSMQHHLGFGDLFSTTMDVLCRIPGNPNISGVGVRIAIYIQNFLCFLPAIWALWDGEFTQEELHSAETQTTTNFVLAFAILVSSIVQALTLGLFNFHASIVLSMSWMNNTNAFVYFLLYIQHKRRSVKPTWAVW